MLRRNCRVYIALNGGLVRPGRRLRGVYSSAQLRSVMAAGMRRRSVKLRSEARGKRASSRSGPNSVSTEGRERGTLRPQGSREMSADETKKGGQTQQSMSRCGLVRPKHRVDSVLPVCGGQSEHGPGRPALQMGCRIIRLPNARTSGPICVSSRRDVVAARLQERSCRTRSKTDRREGRWRRLHKPQANAGPEFDGCLEVMDQASVFLLSRLLRRPGGQWCAPLS